jgi:hypothetical protein
MHVVVKISYLTCVLLCHQMYYNMRIKTLKRNTTNILRKGKEALLARKSQVMISPTMMGMMGLGFRVCRR